MSLGEVPHRRGEDARGQRGSVSDSQTLPAPGRPHAFQRLVSMPEQFMSFADEGFSDRGKADGMSLPLQKALADLRKSTLPVDYEVFAPHNYRKFRLGGL